MNRRPSIALGFLLLIAIGAVLLAAPFSRTDGVWGSPLASAFMSCSAVCVTGLSVVDVGAEYTKIGQLILLALVEVGCLGLMTFGTFLMIAIGRRLSLSREFSLMNAYGVAAVKGLRGLVVWVIGTMLIVEAAGAAVLYVCTHDVYESCFYAIMGFCNAGFGLRTDSLASFAGSPLFVLTMAFETIIGGIGFLVVYNLFTFRFSGNGNRGRLSLHARVVLRYTAWLTIIAFVAFFLLERGGALADCGSIAKRLWMSFYQAITPRTCGFCLVPTEDLKPLTRLFYEALMFIGGAPGSAAAGMKVTTFAVLLHTLRAMCRGESETVICDRVVSYDTVREAFVVFMALVVLTFLVIGALFMTETGTGIASDALVFEAVSAVTTTGLSVGNTTASLSVCGKIVIMAAMFAGRLGALTVVLMIGDREVSSHVRRPSGELVIG